ncbi:unnamed protein product [Pylaiella littoralis]
MLSCCPRRASQRFPVGVFQWGAWSNGCPWDEGTCVAAAFGGHLSVFQWTLFNDCP